MDYRDILNIAKQNSENAKAAKEKRGYPATLTPPTKVTTEKKSLSDNIKRFLAKREEEERQKAMEKHLKAQELMAKRGGKGKKKIEKMLKVIKSANKSVLDDAIDAQESALGTESLEDDYGYTSAVASQFYAKMMDKYKNTPTESMFSEAKKRSMSSEELARVKARVRNGIMKEQEEQHAPRTRKSRTSKADGCDERGTVPELTQSPPPPPVSSRRDDAGKQSSSSKGSANEERKPVVRKPNVPPPPNFSDLLKIAEAKQFEPIKIDVPSVKKREQERPLTSKEKREYEERKAFLEMKRLRDKVKEDESLSEQEKQRKLARLDALRAAGKLPGIPPLPATAGSGSKAASSRRPSSPVGSNARTQFKIPKRNADGSSAETAKVTTPPRAEKPASVAPKPTPSSAPELRAKPSAGPTKPTGSAAQKSTVTASVSKSSTPRPISKPSSAANTPTPSVQKSTTAVNGKSSSHTLPKSASSSATANGKSTPKPVGPAPTKAPANGKQHQQPAASLRPASAAPTKRPLPAPATQTRQFPPPDVQRTVKRRDVGGRPAPNKKRRVIDSDSEYDSEMDDFIDDDDCEEDYSSAIKDIFGYDKSRYRDEYYDDDDDNMESSYAQQMREEYISKKIGLLEDLEDMRMEEEEKRRKSGSKKGGPAGPKKK
ncbi:protein SPT2 homolog [Anopheles stephensi]|uniref:protein SPT2 homolog n=1 Tax=Anopheles stephensi TaxID=30069 RepID=UPI0016587292|nr:protein SPT2 homolog [Anopheles stephensi]XP_035919445.1 protein SPT2 homolog [Anopheles stephensi]